MSSNDIYNEKELTILVSQGDEHAFSILFHHYIVILKPFVFSFTKSDAIADELIQDIFIRVWLARDKLKEVESFKSWLYKIAANECYRFLRRNGVEKKVISQFTSELSESSDSVNDHISVEEIKRIITQTITRLAPRQKHIYRLSREQGMKMDEIANELNISVNTVKNVLVTTGKIIRSALEKAGYVLPVSLFVFQQ